MAFSEIHANPAFSALRRFGVALTDAVAFVLTAGPRAEALRRLSRASDEELTRRGTTRGDEVRRIVGVRAYS